MEGRGWGDDRGSAVKETWGVLTGKGERNDVSTELGCFTEYQPFLNTFQNTNLFNQFLAVSFVLYPTCIGKRNLIRYRNDRFPLSLPVFSLYTRQYRWMDRWMDGWIFNNYSPTLRWTIVLVDTKPVNSQRQKEYFILSKFLARASILFCKPVDIPSFSSQSERDKNTIQLFGI